MGIRWEGRGSQEARSSQESRGNRSIALSNAETPMGGKDAIIYIFLSHGGQMQNDRMVETKRGWHGVQEQEI